MATSIWEHFCILPDPRVERTKLHKLEDILTIAICAVICGAETWVDIADFGRAKKSWLRTFRDDQPEINHIIFGSAEYGKDGLLPLTELSASLVGLTRITGGAAKYKEG